MLKTKAKLFSCKAALFGLLIVLTVVSLSFPRQAAQAATLSLSPVAVGNFDDWSATGTSNKVDAAAINDGDSQFISMATSTLAQTFSFAEANVPAGATINSVTLTAQAKKDGFGTPQIKLRVEDGVSVSDGSIHALTDGSSYSSVSRTMATNPITNTAWTVAEVNSWTAKFGVVKGGINGIALVTQISLIVDYSTPAVPVLNPPLPNQTCGLDIALVLDNSGSIGSNLPAMKSSFNTFVSSLLPGTPTYFSVTYFDGVAHYSQQTFSNNASTTIAAINSVPAPSGQTNWEDGFIKAAATFDPRPGTDHPNLIIFASDGQPNRYGPGGSLGVGGTVDPDALNAAVEQANIIKNSGTRIVTLGIGSGVIQANMEAISSLDAYYSVSDFSQLSATLNTIASQMCGSTITVSKKIDIDGNLTTTNDQSQGGTGFTFDVSPNYTRQVTDANGQTPAVAVAVGSYTVSEANVPPGFLALGGSCSGATNNGTATGTIVSGLQVNGNDIVACTFYNKPIPAATGADISILKTVSPATANVGDTVTLTLVVKNLGPDNATGVVASDTLPSTLTFISASSTVGSYNATTGLWNIGNLANGASATTTITVTVNAGTAGQTLTNTATVSSTTNDPNPGNNSSTVTVGVNSPGGCTSNCGGGGNSTSTDLSLVKTVDKSSINQGDTLIYTLVVKNSGPNTATGVTATDTLPSTVTFVSATSTVGSYNASTSLWTIGTLLSGDSATTTITAIVNSISAGQTIINSASVIAITFDPDLTNNSSSAGSTMPTPPGGGGGGSSGGGGGGGGGCSDPGGCCPNGICGNPATSSGGGGSPSPSPSGGGGGGLAMPQVLGEATALPRTGMPIGFFLFVFAIVLAFVDRKYKLI